MNPLYDIIVQGAALTALPVLATRRNWRAGLGQRFGRWPDEVFARLSGKPVVWVHTASVGEVNAARVLVERLFAACPDHDFLVTTTTTTGRARAEALFGKRAGVALLPLDAYTLLAPVIERVKPRALLVFETELWPRFLSLARRGGARVIMVNGRISARSFGRYLRLKRFMRPVLANFDMLLMNGDDSAQRILALGAPAERVFTLGNVKWAGARSEIPAVSVGGWKNAPIFVAGSTHAGEEAAVLDVWKKLRRRHPDLRLALVPRHPQRLSEVRALLDSRGLPYSLRSAQVEKNEDILLVDTMGELAGLYAVATLAFVGGSLVPVGGHNMLEPAACGIAPLYGRHVDNFAEIAVALEARGGAVRVSDADALFEQALMLLEDSGRRNQAGNAALSLVIEQESVLERYIEKLLPVIYERATV